MILNNSDHFSLYYQTGCPTLSKKKSNLTTQRQRNQIDCIEVAVCIHTIYLYMDGESFSDFNKIFLNIISIWGVCAYVSVFIL